MGVNLKRRNAVPWNSPCGSLVESERDSNAPNRFHPTFSRFKRVRNFGPPLTGDLPEKLMFGAAPQAAQKAASGGGFCTQSATARQGAYLPG